MRKNAVIALILAICMLLPSVSLAADKPRTDIPAWTEDTVKQYMIDYMTGDEATMEKLLGLYNIQVRRYMPPLTFGAFLSELKWMTGEFVSFGEYESFEQTDRGTKTHILRLNMEKVDLELFFTHETEDNELTNVELVPVAADIPQTTKSPDATDEPTATQSAEPTQSEVPAQSAEPTQAVVAPEATTTPEFAFIPQDTATPEEAQDEPTDEQAQPDEDETDE